MSWAETKATSCTPCGRQPVVVIFYPAGGGYTAWCGPCWQEVWS